MNDGTGQPDTPEPPSRRTPDDLQRTSGLTQARKSSLQLFLGAFAVLLSIVALIPPRLPGSLAPIPLTLAVLAAGRAENAYRYFRPGEPASTYAPELGWRIATLVLFVSGLLLASTFS